MSDGGMGGGGRGGRRARFESEAGRRRVAWGGGGGLKVDYKLHRGKVSQELIDLVTVTLGLEMCEC